MTTKRNRNLQLDVLRGVAILLVFGRHLELPHPEGLLGALATVWYRIGWIGVDLFFVLSGFLIGGLLMAELEKHGTINVGRFLIRRGLKLYPGYILFIGYLFLMPVLKAVVRGDNLWLTFSGLFAQLWPNVLFLQNYLGSPAGHTWSLAVEEHFYLILPFALALLVAYNRTRLLVPLCFGLAPVFLLLRLFSIAVDDPLAKTMSATHLRLDALLFGVGVRGLAQYMPTRFAALRNWRAPLVVAGVVLWLPNLFVDPDTIFIRTVGLSATFLGSAAFLIAAFHTRRDDVRIGRSLIEPVARAVAWIGVYSYGIYLWHVTVFGILSREVGGRVGGILGTTPLSWIVSVTVVSVGAVAIGAAATRLVEEPVLRLRDRFFPSRSRGLPRHPDEHPLGAFAGDVWPVVSPTNCDLSTKEAVLTSKVPEEAASSEKTSEEPEPPNQAALRPSGRGAAWNAGWNALSTLWTIGISFVIAPLLIHTMGTDQYGILLLIWSVTGILGLVGFGFGEATLRYIAHYFGEGSLTDVNRIMGATLSFYLLVCALVLTTLFAAAPTAASWFGLSPSTHAQLSWLLRLAGVVFVLRAVTQAYASVPMALQRYDINSKVTVVQSIVRSAGYIALALTGFGIFELVLWDVVVQGGTLAAQAFVIRVIAPGVTLLPSLSLRGLAEISGFSIFSFLTYAFHMMQRESAKLILGAQLGPSPVAYLGTPDNVAQRIHMVVASGSETLMPRFSANRDSAVAKSLFWNGTWASLVISLVLLLPLVVLLPDFLALWIGRDFARESATLGQLVALSYILQGAYAPTATYFRGTGRPARVTVVIMFAGLITLGGCVVLIPVYGTVGVGYAYLLGSIPALLGVIDGCYHMFGRLAIGRLFRLVGLPLVMAGLAFGMSVAIRSGCGAIGWAGLFGLGAFFTAVTTVLIVGADAAVGGGPDAPSRQFFDKWATSTRRILLPLRMRAAR